MIRCIIIEDQPPAQRVLQKFISNIDSLELKGIFADVLSAMSCLKTEDIDLIFLDIHLPKISGIDFLKVKLSRAHVILTSAFSEYALESYEYNVIDYLLKPFSFERFKQAISKLPLQENNEALTNTTETLFIKSGYELIKVEINQIDYIQSDLDYTEICTSNKKHLSHKPLRHWQTTLNPKQFVRIHKSYIINISKIKKVKSNRVWINDKMSFPIGRAFKEEFKKHISI